MGIALMARIRSIKPEFPQSESMGRISREARLLFIMLWTYCDDSGRARGNSRGLASLLFPFDDDAPSLIEDWLEELEDEDCIVRYMVGGNTYLQICNWLIHQRIDKPSESKIPPFVEGSRKPRESSRSLLDGSGPGPGPGPGPRTGTKDQDQDQQPSSAEPTDDAPEDPEPTEETEKPDPLITGFAEFWDAYPRKVARKPTLATWKSKKLHRIADKIHADLADRASRDRKWLEGYIPNPKTYLNQERWEDEVEAVVPQESHTEKLKRQIRESGLGGKVIEGRFQHG